MKMNKILLYLKKAVYIKTVLRLLLGCVIITISTTSEILAQDVSILPSTDYKLEISGKLNDTTDFFGRKRFSGTIINREKNRIDFIKVSFTLRDREGEILETVEMYVNGQRHRYRDRQVSTSTLSPGRTGTFDFISSIDAQDVFSYTYTISGVQFIYP